MLRGASPLPFWMPVVVEEVEESVLLMVSDLGAEAAAGAAQAQDDGVGQDLVSLMMNSVVTRI